MNRSNHPSLLRPFSGRVTRMGLMALLSCTIAVAAYGQPSGMSGDAQTPDFNREALTRTWSVYAEGGMSWASGVWYQSINAKRSYRVSPAMGGGVDFHIKPWVRVGAEYLWSRYRREQRFSSIDSKQMPVKAYGNYVVNDHKVRLGADFNLMELWPLRTTQWLNVYAGTGVGCLFARGNEYGIWFSNTITQNGTTSPVTPDASIGNASSLTITGNVRTTNTHSSFRSIYIPTSLHIEANLSPRIAVGVKGELDWLVARKEPAPKHLVFALATLRYNFVPSRTKTLAARYEVEIDALNGRMDALRCQAEADRLRAERAESRQQELDKRLQVCEQEKRAAATAGPQAPVVVLPSHFVQFANNSSSFDAIEAERLRAFAQSVQGHRLNLVAEASTPGDTDYNQQLSERRLQRVIDFLVGAGFAAENLRSAVALGERNGKPEAEGRRVSITIK